MAELSKIRKNGVDYDIKDSTAREAIEELKKNGVAIIQTETEVVISVTDKNGTTTATITNGKDGKDYVLTDADKYEITETVKAEVPLVKVAEQPTFVNSVDGMTDTSKVYVLLPAGLLYAYMKTQEASSYTFTADDFVEGALNTDGDIYESDAVNRIFTADLIDLSVGTVSIICPSPYQYITYYYTDNDVSAYIGKTTFKSGNVDDVLNDTAASGTIEGAKYCRISLRDKTDTNADISGRTDEFMANIIISQDRDETTEVYKWKSTGLSYNQPADYEDRVAALEKAMEGIENGTY